MIEKAYPMTAEGKAKLEAELEDLKVNKRKEIPTFTVAKPKNPHKSRYICVYGDFFIFWYVDMHACVCLFSRRGEYLLTQAHPECR